MYTDLKTVTLKTGEKVSAGVVKGPDPEWAEKIEKLLEHKGDPWNWQNTNCLRKDLGIDSWFYLLHRDGKPCSSILTAELAGVGNLGHVWTNPEDRRKGAMAALMPIQMDHFRSRQGKALFLTTGYDSNAYHIYRKFGFKSVEEESGYMEYYPGEQQDFRDHYFSNQPSELRPLDWTHWPAASALFTGNFAGVVRCLPMKIIGRVSTEHRSLYLIRDQLARAEKGEAPRVMVLQNPETTAVTGLALWDPHPLWPDIYLVDIYCHPRAWDQAPELLAGLELPSAKKYLAYVEVGFMQKQEALTNAGFKQALVLPERIPDKGVKLDVMVFEK